jgi:hypothetical protein
MFTAASDGYVLSSARLLAEDAASPDADALRAVRAAQEAMSRQYALRADFRHISRYFHCCFFHARPAIFMPPFRFQPPRRFDFSPLLSFSFTAISFLRRLLSLSPLPFSPLPLRFSSPRPILIFRRHGAIFHDFRHCFSPR